MANKYSMYISNESSSLYDVYVDDTHIERNDHNGSPFETVRSRLIKHLEQRLDWIKNVKEVDL